MNTRIIPGLNTAFVVLALAGALWLSAFNAPAQTTPSPPDLMTYQGFLVDGNGMALGLDAPKNYDVIFRIWDAAAGGNLLWTEQQTVVVDKGYFSVMLGEGSGIGEPRPGLSTLFADNTASDRWVGMTVKGIGPGGGNADILPRLRLLTSPYSFLAHRAVTARMVDGAVPDATLSANVALRAGGNILNGNQTVTNGAFVGDGTIPLGGIIMWSGSIASIPSGWALCNGQTNNGVVTPDLRDRFIAGAGGSYAVGSTGGASQVTLDISQIPSHHHAYNDVYMLVSWQTGELYYNWRDAVYASPSVPYDNGFAFSNGQTLYGNYWQRGTYPTGGGQPHENRPPYYALAFLMRVR